MCFILACDIRSMGCYKMTSLLRKKKEDDKEGTKRCLPRSDPPDHTYLSGWTPKVDYHVLISLNCEV